MDIVIQRDQDLISQNEHVLINLSEHISSYFPSLIIIDGFMYKSKYLD